MKNSEIHEGFDQREVRNFLANQLADSYQLLPQPELNNLQVTPLIGKLKVQDKPEIWQMFN